MHHAVDNFAYQFTQICFCGHSHVPVAFEKKPLASMAERSVDVIEDWAPVITEEDVAAGRFLRAEFFPVEIKPGYKYLFNVGSIGQPRNRDPRSSFAVYDTGARTITRYVIPYDIATAQAKIIAAGLPERLARRLSTGV
jgi:diadenosine tetraphosphatase ApaH/serine/threonine PP2A family protein phosphatase